jgi:hypothetical protein
MAAIRTEDISGLKLEGLSKGQLHWLTLVADALRTKAKVEVLKSDLLDKDSAEDFADALKINHVFSDQPISKDKFEHVLNDVLLRANKKSKLADKGNPGHDIEIDGIRFSLKSQADKGIKSDMIWISKFMEMGKGEWTDDPRQLVGLRQRFLDHMKQYDRILTLRCIGKKPKWKYELVEIPKSLFQKSTTGELEMMTGSKQIPKPGYCRVFDKDKKLMFSLYFDGGSERKLQVKDLAKKHCIVHATWELYLQSADIDKSAGVLPLSES